MIADVALKSFDLELNLRHVIAGVVIIGIVVAAAVLFKKKR